MPVTVTVAPGSTAPVVSTIVTTSVPAGAGACLSAVAPCANVDARAGVGDETSRTTASAMVNGIADLTRTNFPVCAICAFCGLLRGRVEASRINLGVDPVAIEGRFFRGFRTGGAPDAEGQLQPVDVAVVREEEA